MTPQQRNFHTVFEKKLNYPLQSAVYHPVLSCPNFPFPQVLSLIINICEVADLLLNCEPHPCTVSAFFPSQSGVKLKMAIRE